MVTQTADLKKRFYQQHLLSTEYITSGELTAFYDFIESFKLEEKLGCLRGQIALNLFFESSTRTRMSFASAFQRLGGSIIEMGSENLTSIKKGESLEDMSKVISSYGDIMILRHPEERAVECFAKTASIPVINAGNGIGEHPTQALLDIYTIQKECRRVSLDYLTICLVGDLKYGRTVHSLIKLLANYKAVQFYFVSPSELKMPADLTAMLKLRGHTVIETDKLETSVQTVEVIYMTRIQQERFSSQQDFLICAEAYSLNQAFYERYCKQEPILLHPLPRNSSLSQKEFDSTLENHPKLAVFRQAHYGVLVRMALLSLILKGN